MELMILASLNRKSFMKNSRLRKGKICQLIQSIEVNRLRVFMGNLEKGLDILLLDTAI
jgi:hypothetical protein